MQEDIQARANVIADRFGIAHVQVARRQDLVTEAARMEAMRHEMAHVLHAQLEGAEKGNNVHGRNWRKWAVKVGAEPKAQVWCKAGGHKPARKNVVARGARVIAQVAPKFVVRQPVEVQAGEPTTKQGWMDYIQQHGLQKLGQGASRTTYALDDKRVVKINTSYWEQCESEYKVWQNATAELRPMLAEVFAGGVGFIVMERAKCTLRQFTRDDNASRTISDDLRSATRIGDLHAANIGYFGAGVFKIIDYAL